MLGRALSLALVLIMSTEAQVSSSSISTTLYPARITFYEVKGDTPEEIRTSMDTLGPKDDFGRKRDAFTRWNVSWRWPSKEGKPLLKEVEVKSDIEVILPKLLNKIDSSTEKSWNDFYNAVVNHEAQHVSFVVTLAPKVKEEILKALDENPSLSFQEANRIGKRLLKEIRAKDLKLDHETVSGKKEGVIWPPQKSVNFHDTLNTAAKSSE